MVIDSSAIVQIILSEPGFEKLLESIRDAKEVFISASTFFECSIVIDHRPKNIVTPFGSLDTSEFCELMEVQIVPFDEAQAKIARDAYKRFGRGSKHPANLNFGDCFSYALAKSKNDTLLFVGEDFAKTDIKPAVLTG